MKCSPSVKDFLLPKDSDRARIEPDPNSKDHVFIVDFVTGKILTRAKAKNGKPVKGIFVAERPIFIN
jgi:hypothetical protein